MTRRLVVIGGDAAGMSAASAARRLAGPDDLEIVAYERGGYTSYSACGIPYYIADARLRPGPTDRPVPGPIRRQPSHPRPPAP